MAEKLLMLRQSAVSRGESLPSALYASKSSQLFLDNLEDTLTILTSEVQPASKQGLYFRETRLALRAGW